MNDVMTIPEWSEPQNLKEAERAILGLSNTAHENFYLLGKHFIWVKDSLKHGEFETWWESKKRPFTTRTVRKLMAYTERCDEAGGLINYETAKSEGSSVLSPPLPPGKYRLLYADPPWKYSDSREELPK